jgi:hypothetical protein
LLWLCSKLKIGCKEVEFINLKISQFGLSPYAMNEIKILSPKIERVSKPIFRLISQAFLLKISRPCAKIMYKSHTT